MTSHVLDAGPIVAILDVSERHHAWSVNAVDTLTGRLFTCEAVVSEAWFLARRGGGDPARVLELLRLLEVEIVPGWSAEAERVLSRFSERASVADACLVALSEAEGATVVTLDRLDFSIYRTGKGLAVRAHMPPVR